MKRIKNLFISLVVISFVCLFSVVDVKAAGGCSWIVEGNFVPQGENTKESYYLDFSDNNHDGGVLVLKDYDGGKISYEARGTCLESLAVVKLIGKNKITVSEGAGISSISNIKFIGDGSLSINAIIPIEYKTNANNITINGILEEDEKAEIEQQPDENKDKKDEDVNVKDEEKDNEETSNFDVYTIINFGLLAINIIILLFLIIKMSKKEK